MARLQNMTLKQKGPVQLPPNLGGFPQKVSKAVQAMPGVTSATHWEIDDRSSADGADFYLGSRELGHIHFGGEIHMPVTQKWAKELIRAKIAEPFMYSDAWVTFQISTKQDVATAIELFELNRMRINGASSSEIKAFIENLKR